MQPARTCVWRRRQAVDQLQALLVEAGVLRLQGARLHCLQNHAQRIVLRRGRAHKVQACGSKGRNEEDSRGVTPT